jgi:hypothetical protein
VRVFNSRCVLGCGASGCHCPWMDTPAGPLQRVGRFLSRPETRPPGRRVCYLQEVERAKTFCTYKGNAVAWGKAR